MQTNLRFDHQLLAVEAEHDVHCMLELHAPPAPTVDRPPLHLALVVDRSGSMAGPKLDAARQSARFLVGRLRADDRIALVAFDDEVQLLAPIGPPDRPEVLAAIEAIEPGGCTNLSGGWLKGLEELDRLSEPATRRVLLLTDGQANEGIVDRDDLERIASGTKARAATTTIGFGDGFDEDLLAALAAHSGGNTYFAETPEAAPGIFGEEFDGLASLVAQNVSVEIRPGDAVDVLGVLNDYPCTTVPDGMQVQVGDAYGDEVRRIVFQLHIPNMAQLGPAKVADVIVRYVAIGDEIAQHELKVPVTVNLVTSDEAARGRPRRRGHRAGLVAAGGEGTARGDRGRGSRRLGRESRVADRRVGRLAVTVLRCGRSGRVPRRGRVARRVRGRVARGGPDVAQADAPTVLARRPRPPGAVTHTARLRDTARVGTGAARIHLGHPQGAGIRGWRCCR